MPIAILEPSEGTVIFAGFRYDGNDFHHGLLGEDKAKTSIQIDSERDLLLKKFEGKHVRWAGYVVDVWRAYNDTSKKDEPIVTVRFELLDSVNGLKSLTLSVKLPFEITLRNLTSETGPGAYERSLANYTKGQPVWFESQDPWISFFGLKNGAVVTGTVKPREVVAESG